MTYDWDAIVVGAGAAGLMAGIFAAERGRRVLVVEKNRKPGVKILMSGGTRCNITHDCDVRGIIAAFGPNGKFLHSALARFTPQDVVAFFHAEGVFTKIEDTGKIFPVSDKALDVLNALLRRLERSGATLSLAEPVLDVNALSPGFEVVTNRRKLTAEHLLITTGGLSFPGCGTTGDGYTFVRKFGHTVTATYPALVPLRVNIPWVKEMMGLTIPNVKLTIRDATGAILTSRAGSTLFAHFGLTGPAPLDVSRAVSSHEKPSSCILELDFLPELREEQYEEYLKTESIQQGKKQLAGVMAEKLPRRLVDQMLAIAKMPLDRKAAALSKDDRKTLVTLAKRMQLPLVGTLGYEKAEVTSGGVSLKEVDSRTLQSLKHPGLFLAGEVLDLDGWIGGYNFQSAWSTGKLAGENL
jgi:predicted Rossmann fold flavoprotein